MQAHYFLGLALAEQQNAASAIIHLEKVTPSLTSCYITECCHQSYELAHDRGETIMDEIWKTIARVSYTEWKRSASKRSEEDRRLKERLRSLLTEAYHHEMKYKVDRAALARRHAEEQESLERLFRRASVSDQPQEIPGCYTCVMTMDVFRDPVITPAGFTYEQAVLQQHMKRNGCYDPVTRQSFDPSQLVQNIGLRSASHLYLKEHPWAWKECM